MTDATDLPVGGVALARYDDGAEYLVLRLDQRHGEEPWCAVLDGRARGRKLHATRLSVLDQGMPDWTYVADDGSHARADVDVAGVPERVETLVVNSELAEALAERIKDDQAALAALVKDDTTTMAERIQQVINTAAPVALEPSDADDLANRLSSAADRARDQRKEAKSC